MRKIKALTDESLLNYMFDSEKTKEIFKQKFGTKTELFKVSEIPTHTVAKDSLLFIASNEVAYLTHGLHEFPAKFIPHVPRWAIKKFTEEGEVVLDPFCGCGTSLVEAKLLNRHSYGIDIEPLAQFLTKVKATPVNTDKLISIYNRLIARIENDSREDMKLPVFPNREHWFRPKVLEDLAIIRRNIMSIKDEDIRDFFLACFSSIIKKASNADPEFVYALAYSKRMKELDREGRRINAIARFKEVCSKQVPEMVKFSQKAHNNVFARVVGKDARDIDLEDDSIDLAVTSPPYINAVDYVRAHKLEMYWLDLLHESTLELQRKFIGTERVSAKDYSEIHKLGFNEVDRILEHIYAKDKIRSYIVYKFFVDMRKNFEEVKRVLRRHKRYVVVIGDSVIRKIHVPTHKILQLIGEDVGFTVEESFGYIIRSRHMKIPRQGIGGLIEADWITVFRKS